MTRSKSTLAAIVPLIADLSRDLPARERYRRYLHALSELLPCDAVALLRLDGDTLVPVAVQGLSPDTLGRRFLVSAHPRLQALLTAQEATLFPSDCAWPDPYDGLVEGVAGDLTIHDCMGCAVRMEQGVWGVLTLDSLASKRFSEADLDVLDAFSSVAAATVMAAARIDQLALTIEQERRRSETYQRAAEAPRHVLMGQSDVFRRMVEEIDLVAASDLTVLISGETGVGKELVARRLHDHSARAGKTLVSLNCAALPDSLVESELFGHVRGAFSGAVSERRGKFELADGGTLFLDEIGELPLAIQAKLLRVLQNGQLQRIGSDREHRVDVRLIAATNRDLAAEVRAGRFRADLYHRLSVYPLRVPPLRERGADVVQLAGTFLEESRRRLGLRGLRLSRDAQSALVAYDWPGNVRELEHLIGRSTLTALRRQSRATASGVAHAASTSDHAVILTIEEEDLGALGSTAMQAAPSLPVDTPLADARRQSPLMFRDAVDDYQRALIVGALAQHEGNASAAARALGMDRANLSRLARRLGI